jgi:hypothetical protein
MKFGDRTPCSAAVGQPDYTHGALLPFDDVGSRVERDGGCHALWQRLESEQLLLLTDGVRNGGGFLAHQDWWALAALAAGAVAVLLMALYFTPWLSAGILISAAILYAGAQALQQS